ncbi:hypothetical protein [Methanobrevibacter sp.]|uniref:hypothetical protein n=1 Tax=Methanobrevibacter sp. TaxID=66852 RepID=UPI00388F0CB0
MSEKKIKDRVYISKSDRNIYQDLRVKHGVLQGVENADLFLISIFLAYEKEGKNILKKRTPRLSDGLIRLESFSRDAWSIIKAFAVYIDGTVDVLGDTNRIVEIAQSYAYHGIHILNDIYWDNDDFVDYLETSIIDKFDKEKIGL